MTPIELAELKIQLQELLDKGFIWPALGSSGIIYDKKKEWHILAVYRLSSVE
jgi:hypothetical protein